MQVGIMKTDGGPHPADYYAAVAASEIVQVEASAVGQDAIQGRKLENQIIDILEAAHQRVIDAENASLKAAHDHLVTPISAAAHKVHDVAEEVVDAIKASKWGKAVNKDTKGQVQDILTRHFNTAVHVTRSWHADEHADHPVAKQFKQNWYGKKD